jgi:hypothetical protein
MATLKTAAYEPRQLLAECFVPPTLDAGVLQTPLFHRLPKRKHTMDNDGVATIVGAPSISNTEARPQPLIKSSSEFIRGFVPPEYVIEGILQRRFCYSLTAKTGTGKTAVMMRIAAHVALGRELCGRFVARGRVIYFAGENPDDIRMRWIAMSQEMNFDLNEMEVYFIPGTFSIAAMRARLDEEINRIGDITLAIIDTSAAFFEGKDENSNAEQALHARVLRNLCQMPGGPCVLIACHPPKNAGDDNLTPRGGGAFLAEVDGNLTARKGEKGVMVSWHGKFRGPNFPDLLFGLQTVTHKRLQDSRGRLIPTVVANPLGEVARSAAKQRNQEHQLLLQLSATPSASHVELARSLGWFGTNGDPARMKVLRAIIKLEEAKLVERVKGRVILTAAGEAKIRN